MELSMHIDLVTGKTVHRIEGLPDPQGIGYAPKANLVAIASAGDGSVCLYRADDLRTAWDAGSWR